VKTKGLLAIYVQKSHIDGFTHSILRMENHALKVAGKRPHYTQLLSVPGIGKILAMTILNWGGHPFAARRPRRGREFFEEIIRENIDLGRPETVQLIFARKMRKSTVAGGRLLLKSSQDLALGLCKRRPAFNRQRCAKYGRVLECARSLRSNFISLTLGKVRTRKFEKNPFVVIVQDSCQTSIVYDLGYLDLKDGSSLIPLDSLSLHSLLGFPYRTFLRE
jgi:hypothetical protein